MPDSSITMRLPDGKSCFAIEQPAGPDPMMHRSNSLGCLVVSSSLVDIFFDLPCLRSARVVAAPATIAEAPIMKVLRFKLCLPVSLAYDKMLRLMSS